MLADLVAVCNKAVFFRSNCRLFVKFLLFLSKTTTSFISFLPLRAKEKVSSICIQASLQTWPKISKVKEEIVVSVICILCVIIALFAKKISSFSQTSEYSFSVWLSFALPTNLYPFLPSGIKISNGCDAPSGFSWEYKCHS